MFAPTAAATIAAIDSTVAIAASAATAFAASPSHLTTGTLCPASPSDAAATPPWRAVKASLVHSVSMAGVERRCYGWDGAGSDVCFSQRAAAATDASTFTPKDFENMLWSTHAAVIGNDPSVSNDKYNDNHYAVNPSTGAGDNLVKYMTAHSPFPITASSTWAYDCTQDYLIDPTGWAIQVNDWTMTYPNCGDLAAATKIEAKAKAKMAVVESA